MKVGEAYGEGKFGLSFELYPPKSEKAEQELFRQLETLIAFGPSYVTCTYGAGGSTRDKTLSIVERVRREFGSTVAAHLTCVGSTADQLRDYLREAHQRCIENIVALRGDPPSGESSFRPVPGGLTYANELVALLKSEFPQFGIAVAGYPETHQDAPSPQIDLENLKRKVDTGADVVITQLFYENDDFFRFRDRCDGIGIGVPIVPGILPVTSYKQIARITALCGAKLPERFRAELEAQGDDVEGQFEIGVRFATDQVRQLVEAGIPGIHFYVLNQSRATSRVLSAVDLPG